MSHLVFALILAATAGLVILALYLREQRDARARARRRSHRSPERLGGIIAEKVAEPEPITEPDNCPIPEDAYPLTGCSNEQFAQAMRRISKLTGTTSELENTGQWPAFRDNEPAKVTIGATQLLAEVDPDTDGRLARFYAACGDTNTEVEVA
jgi:hypothetical protein